MKDKLYNYLKSRGGCSSSVAIVEQLLNLRGAGRDVAEKIVRSLVKDHSIFISDGLGNWYIDPEQESQGTHLNDIVFNLVAIRGNVRDLFQSTFLEIGVCQIQNGKISNVILERARRDDSILEGASVLVCESRPWSDVLARVLPFLEGGVLTGFKLAPVRNFLYAEALHFCGEYIVLNELFMDKLLRRLYPKQKLQSISELAAFLKVPYFETEDLQVYLNNLSNLFLVLLEKLTDFDLTDLDKLLEFQFPERKQINMESKKISRHFLETLPESAGVYLMKNEREEVIYVGKAKNLKSRVGSYFNAREDLDEKLARIWEKIIDVEIIELGSELEAYLEEQKLIKQYQPEINLQMSVHIKADPAVRNLNLILFLPSTKNGYVNLFCLNSNGRSTCLAISQKRNTSSRAKDKLQKMFFASRSRKPTSEELERSELITRWFVKNRDQVSWMDMNSISDFLECLRLIDKYKNENMDRHERVIYR